MKNKLEAELKQLAKKIFENNTNASAADLKKQAKELYEKLTILSFTEENLAFFQKEDKPEPKAEVQSIPKEEAVVTKNESPVEREVFARVEEPVEEKVEEKDEYLPDGTEYNDSEAITEPNTEMIKDIVAQMPPETEKVDRMLNNVMSRNGSVKQPEAPKEENKTDFRNIGVDYDNLPNFEPVKKQDKDRPRSLNDRLKKGINIGLNERLAFIRHLFDGNTADYNRVISQLNTFDSLSEAKKFIQLVVKPDYKNWMGKEDQEQRFMELVENKFNH